MVTVVGRGNEYDILRAEHEAPAVMAALRAYDPQLLVGWDSSACRWSLLRVSRGGYHFIGVLERTVNGEKVYRELDMSLLGDLARSDLWRGAKNPQELVRKWEEEEDAMREKVETDFRDDIEYLTRWNRRTLLRGTNLLGL